MMNERLSLKSLEHLDKLELWLLNQAYQMLELHQINQHAAAMALERVELLLRWRVRLPVALAGLLLPLARPPVDAGQQIAAKFGIQTLQAIHKFEALARGRRDFSVGEPPLTEDAQALRQLFIQAYLDLDLVLLALADHLALAARLGELDAGERRDWAAVNQAVYLPLLRMLGLWTYRRDLGNLGLAILDVGQYEQLDLQLVKLARQYEAHYEQIEAVLRRTLLEYRCHAEIQLYYPSVINLYLRSEQARQRGESLSRVESGSLLRLDVFPESEPECYQVLGIIHSKWRPAQGQAGGGERFQDYIAAPRYNGFRCLITTVMVGRPEFPVEFRIRTRDMEQINVMGAIAARQLPFPVKNAWWTDLAVAEAVADQERVDQLVAFTPYGEVIFPLQRGSTVIDFAFRAQVSLAPYAHRYWVNGQPVSFSYALHHCDYVQLEYNTRYPALRQDWADHAHTSAARNGIRRFLRMTYGVSHRGRQVIDRVLERESRIYRLRFPQDKLERTLERIARQYDCPTVDALYDQVLSGEIAPDAVVAAMIESELAGHITLESGQSWPVERIRISRDWMQEKQELKWDRATRVMPGAEIVGRLTGRPDAPLLKVYRKDSRYAPPPDQAVPLRWRAATALREAAEITVTAPPRPEVAGQILSAIYAQSEAGLTFHQFQAEIQGATSLIRFLVDAPSMDALQRLQDDLEALQDALAINEFKIWQLFPGQRMLLAGKWDKRHQNPYTLKQVRDRSMFFGREDEIAEIVNQINDGQNFLILYGQKRIGKTSLLYQLSEYTLPQLCDVIPVVLDANGLSPFTPVTFLYALAEAAHEAFIRRFARQQERKGLRLRLYDLEAGNPFQVFAGWVDGVQRRLQGTRLFFMVDEFTRAEEMTDLGRLSAGFFEGIRWLIESAGVGFLLCVHDNIYHQDSASWRMMQSGHPIRLGMLDERAAARLIQQPLQRIYQFNRPVVERLLKLTAGNPYFIQILCWHLASLMSRRRYSEAMLDDLDEVMAGVLRKGDHYFSHFRSSASDQAWATLKTIAYSAGDTNDWVSRDQIREALGYYGIEVDGWQLSYNIQALYRAGIIDVRSAQDGVAYRIPVGLFQVWLRQTTHPLITLDMQRSD